MQLFIILIVIPLILFCEKYNINAKAILSENIFIANDAIYSPVICIVRLNRRNTTASSNEFRDTILCTGTFITSSHILTAEHCAHMLDERRVQIIAESIDVRLGQRYNIMWWITHKQWAVSQHRRTRYVENDISMIKTIEFAPDTIVPAVVSTQRRTSLFGSTVVMAGWGDLLSGESPLLLHAATVTVITDDHCSNIYAQFQQHNIFFSIGELCSLGEPFALLEFGDSGGPLLMGNTIIAVNIGTCPQIPEVRYDTRQANIHSSVHFYRVFIHENSQQ